MKLSLSREARVGLLAVVAVVLLLWGLSYLRGRSVFESTFTVYAVYPHVKGLTEGNPVLINGFKIGTVNAMSLDGKTGNIRVSLELQNTVKLPVDSRAIIASSGLIGGMNINLLRGSATTYLASGDTLADSLEIALLDRLTTEITPVKQKIEILLDELTAVSRSVKAALGDTLQLKRMVGNAELTTRHLASIARQADGAMVNIDTLTRNLSAVTSTIRQNDKAISRILSNTASVSDSLAASMTDVRASLAQTRSTLTSIDSVMQQVRKGQGNVGKLLYDDKLYTNLTASAKSLDELLIDLRKKPGKFLTVAIFGRKN
jgi:phospholipid/cholesterol/gamma-HCH transport system substrate-binding protein